MLNKRTTFTLINAANVQSELFKANFVNSREKFLSFENRALGIPLLIPADPELFTFEEQDTFELKQSEILRVVYDTLDENYIGFRHAFNGLRFLKNFKIKDKFKEYTNNIISHNLDTAAYVAGLKKRFNNVGAFQTRNIPHHGHELIIQRLLSECEHVVVNPVVGPKKHGDVKIECLKLAFEFLSSTKYGNRVSFKPLLANMFYAGPREAMHHALMRQRLGFDYFTVGRDHAGASGAYQPHAASKLIEQNRKNLTINVMTHNGAAFCHYCRDTVLIGDCVHASASMTDISGTDFRASLTQHTTFTLADAKMQSYILNSDQEIFET